MSLQSLAEALSSACSVQLLGIILALSGLDNNESVQTQQAMDWVGHSFTIIPAFFMIISTVMVLKYPITKKSHEMVKIELDKRKSG